MCNLTYVFCIIDIVPELRYFKTGYMRGQYHIGLSSTARQLDACLKPFDSPIHRRNNKVNRANQLIHAYTIKMISSVS